MESESIIRRILADGFLPLLRLPPEALPPALEAVLASGITIVATSTDSAAALEVVARAGAGRQAVLGAEVRSLPAARDALRAGARFLLMPALDAEAVRLCREAHVPIIPGALTPTEVRQGRELGAEALQAFPAGPLGPGYLAALHRAAPDVSLLASGEVSPKQVGSFLEGGAAGIVGGECLPWSAAGASGIVASLQEFREAIRRARGQAGRAWWGRWAPQQIRPTEGPDK